MAKRAKRPPTWLDVAIRNVGLRRAVRAINWAYCWAVVREVDGNDPAAERVAEWWAMGERTAYRDQADFRAAFPGLDTPAAIYDSPEARDALAAHAQLGQRMDQWKADRKARREASMFTAAQLPAQLP